MAVAGSGQSFLSIWGFWTKSRKISWDLMLIISNFNKVTCNLNNFPVWRKLLMIIVYIVVFYEWYIYINLTQSTSDYIANKCLKLWGFKSCLIMQKINFFPLSFSLSPPHPFPSNSYIWHDCSPHVKELPWRILLMKRLNSASERIWYKSQSGTFYSGLFKNKKEIKKDLTITADF